MFLCAWGWWVGGCVLLPIAVQMAACLVVVLAVCQVSGWLLLPCSACMCMLHICNSRAHVACSSCPGTPPPTQHDVCSVLSPAACAAQRIDLHNSLCMACSPPAVGALDDLHQGIVSFIWLQAGPFCPSAACKQTSDCRGTAWHVEACLPAA
ncbi:hypothetical protein COO60DRAFT_1558790 [Scenedesmus sp. NREL 46B-D3]|nr:hypothetical protein COO60DRAFT_1558790 [Scenedesmus sp. NREL 46B-D3]